MVFLKSPVVDHRRAGALRQRMSPGVEHPAQVSPAAAAANAEKRARIRVLAQLPLTVKFGGVYEAMGEAVNISARGMFFVMDCRLEPGNEVELVFRLPRKLIGMDGVWLRCRAEIVRVQAVADNRFGVAARIKTYEVFRVS